jgi:NAD(P) transhydrogenase subunit beta
MHTAISFSYIVAAIFFALGLKMMGSPKSARQGNLLSAAGMLIASVATLATTGLDFLWIFVALLAGSAIGAVAALKVKMTAMPEMVALFNGSGGLASMLVAWAKIHQSGGVDRAGVLSTAALAALVGVVTFTGSAVAWGKLSGVFPSRAIVYRGQRIVNAFVLLTAVASGLLLSIGYVPGAAPAWVSQTVYLWILLGAGALVGIVGVIPIGGADMPVVISLLNSYSGLAACAAGFAIGNSVLVVAGSLVGASGIILTRIMCKAMNRSLTNVLFGGFGAVQASSSKKDGGGTAQSATVQDTYYVLEAARNVVFVPGYGMAVARAQHAVKELSDLLESNGATVQFAIHPVAGRMPGHMNVLLAEANVSYDKLVEMEEINGHIAEADACIVIGANDVVNPAARDDAASAIYGMPIIEADRARSVFVLKRSMASGFAGIENPLFYRENTRMVFGDAKATIEAIVAEFKA